jgi:hypothetical protein
MDAVFVEVFRRTMGIILPIEVFQGDGGLRGAIQRAELYMVAYWKSRPIILNTGEITQPEDRFMEVDIDQID